MMTVLTIPGWHGSGPAHWQSRWEALHGAQRVAQGDWDHPVLSTWVAALDRAVASQAAPVVLAAHSLGCALVAHWAAYAQPAGTATIRAALLVAPPDVEREDIAADVLGFAPMPARPLPFVSLVVASADDPYCSLDRAAGFAADWGSDFVHLGAAGHLNADSGLGDWPTGWEFVESWS